MNGRFETRVAQICASLISEGHILVGSLPSGFYAFRHPNGRRLMVIADYPDIVIRERGRTIKSETVTPVYPSRNKPEV